MGDQIPVTLLKQQAVRRDGAPGGGVAVDAVIREDGFLAGPYGIEQGPQPRPEILSAGRTDEEDRGGGERVDG